jgi:hypothetical protein
MMLKIQLIVFFLILSCLSFSQIDPKTPSWVNVEVIDKAKTINQNEVRDGYYYLLVDEQYNTLQKQNYFHYATKIVSEAGLDYASQIEINYDPSYQKAVIHHIKIHRGNQIINKANASEIKLLTEEKNRGQGILNGYKTLYANLSGVMKGDIIEYDYSIIGYNKIFDGKINFEFWISYSVPVGKVIYRVMFSKSDSLTIKNLNTNVNPVIKDGPYNDYSWVIDQPKILKVDDNIPTWYDPYPTVQLSTVNSWTDVKTWFAKLFKVITSNNELIKETVSTIVKNKSNKLEQVTGIVDFVQNSIRYSGNENGIYSHVPHNPEMVLKNAFGDCKDKSLLLCEMLKKIDVEAYPVLLNTNLKKTVQNHLPSLNKFDHCIVAIKWENKLYYLDPTVSYQRGSFAERTATNLELGLVIDDTKETFRIIPTNTNGKIEVIEEYDVDEVEGDTKLRVQFKYYGPSANQVRYYFATNSRVDVQQYYKDYYLKYADDIEIIDSLKVEDDSINNVFTSYEYYTLKKFWAIDSAVNKNVVSKDFIPNTLNEKLIYVDAVSRKDPMQINFPINIEQEIKITKAAGWNIKDKEFTEKNMFYDFFMSNAVEENTLILKYKYKAKKENVEVSEYKLYKEKMEILNNSLIFSVSQTMNTEKDSEGGTKFNWLLLLVVLGSLIASVIVCLKLFAKDYPSIYEKTYDSIGGWLILVAFGLVITPFAFLVEIVVQFKDSFALDYYSVFFSTDSASYSPLKGYYLVFANLGNIFFLVSSVFLAILFFKQKSSFRVYFVFFRLINFVFLLIDLLVIYILNKDSADYTDQNLITSQTTEIIKMFVQSCIWVPYIWYSERSRHTFTSYRKPIDPFVQNQFEGEEQ